MTRCSETRKLIDEADRAEVFSYEVARHIASCPPCKDFAEERARLRQLIASSARVVAPANFDALLSRRLAEARSRRSFANRFALAGPAGLLKLGAATAAVGIAVFAASYSGLFSTSGPPAAGNEDRVAVAPRMTVPTVSDDQQPPPKVDPQPEIVRMPSEPVRIASNVAPRQARQVAVKPVVIEPEVITPATQMVILRGEDFEREIPMPTISVGAQPLMYVGATRTSTSSVRASF